ncbi:MAG: aminotransferase class I/II-fold pyridoxal phosphate-dependent enzyme [Oscillospiraceae bacterium]|nr:aminotransferase class I/II-fold pyridoxal phosphate-dependent enzyme [Oscillospiraceae bacterium]
MKPNFRNDYSEIMHPRILARLAEQNLTKRAGYGTDEVCASAAAKLRLKLTRDDADVHFLVGGTSANLIALSAFLRPHEAVICAATAHINVHETGSIEAAGHKLINIETRDGKLTPSLIEQNFARYTDEHMVKPKLVFIANATELGTHYALAELRALRAVCDRLGLLLYMDGARIGSAMAASEVGFADLCCVCDAFYIGGTKNGAPVGEAMVIVNPKLKHDFRYIEKQRGGMLAKGFILGHIFDVLFDCNLYLELAGHANKCADKLRSVLAANGVPLAYETATNQVFAIVPNGKLGRWTDGVICEINERRADETVLRFVTSWATSEEDLRAFEDAVAGI